MYSCVVCDDEDKSVCVFLKEKCSRTGERGEDRRVREIKNRLSDLTDVNLVCIFYAEIKKEKEGGGKK